MMNGSRVWAHLPPRWTHSSQLMGRAKSVASLSMRQRAILVTATASTMGDSDRSLAWGQSSRAQRIPIWPPRSSPGQTRP